MKGLRITVVLAVIGIAFMAGAQNKLKALTKQLQSSTSEFVSLSEKRDPATKKLESSDLTMQFSDDAIGNKIREAIEAERVNSTKYENIENRMYTLRFEYPTYRLTYQLIKRNGADKPWIYIVSERYE